MSGPVLCVRDLTVEFDTPDGVVRAVTDVAFDLAPGETLAIVGESGSGKTVTALSLLGLVPKPPGRVVRGSALLHGTDLLTLPAERLRAARGRDIAMVFQNPMTSLNPVHSVGAQIAEALAAHDPRGNRASQLARAAELLDLVGMPDPRQRARCYPHELSGGMRQRVMIAMAIANRPSVLVADEPTTALDVTIQAQVLDVLRTAQRETRAATLLITHDLGVVAELADRVAVMYAGRIVEVADAPTLFARPRHPYTLGLLSSLPRLDAATRRLPAIAGRPPSLLAPPPGCAFHPRCATAGGRAACHREIPALLPVADGHHAACHFWQELDA